MTVLNDREIQRMLREYRGQIGRRSLVNALRQGAEVIRAGASERAPRGATGKLAASMTIWPLSRYGRPVYLIGPSKEAWYAHMVEFGTKAYERGDTREVFDRRRGRSYTKKVTRRHTATAAQPFLGPAVEEDKDIALLVIKRHLAGAIARGRTARRRAA